MFHSDVTEAAADTPGVIELARVLGVSPQVAAKRVLDALGWEGGRPSAEFLANVGSGSGAPGSGAHAERLAWHIYRAIRLQAEEFFLFENKLDRLLESAA